MTTTDIKQLADENKFEIEGMLSSEGNTVVDICFSSKEDEELFFIAEVYCRNLIIYDIDEHRLPAWHPGEEEIDIEIELESFTDQDDNNIDLPPIEEQLLIEIILEKCWQS